MVNNGLSIAKGYNMELTKTNEAIQKNIFSKITEYENALTQIPGAKFGDDACPLKHSFGDGLYIREITMPAGMVLTSKIHKTSHPYFIIRGDVTVVSDEGMVRIKAPYWGMTKAGTKRALKIHEETVWITVHATKETDLKQIEAELIADDYESLPDHVRMEIEGGIE
jgi:hypothetical protein